MLCIKRRIKVRTSIILLNLNKQRIRITKKIGESLRNEEKSPIFMFVKRFKIKVKDNKSKG